MADGAQGRGPGEYIHQMSSLVSRIDERPPRIYIPGLRGNRRCRRVPRYQLPARHSQSGRSEWSFSAASPRGFRADTPANFDTHYKPLIRNGAPVLAAQRLASYVPCQIGDKWRRSGPPSQRHLRRAGWSHYPGRRASTGPYDASAMV